MSFSEKKKYQMFVVVRNRGGVKMKGKTNHEHVYILNRLVLNPSRHTANAEYVCSDCGNVKNKEYPDYVNPPMFFKEFA